ncbi:MAG: glycosyltransferase [Erysipelotrichaceae bacterium]
MKEKLNVCLLNDSFPPLIDGVANAVVNYGEIIQDKYGNAIVATPEYPDVDDSQFSFSVKRYSSIDTTKLVGYRAGLPFEFRFINQFSKDNVDILHSHCPIASTFLARIIRDKIQVPLIFTYHTKFDIDIKNAIDNKFIQEAAIKLLVENIEACDEIWTVSKGAGENLKSLGFKGECIVMENGVDFSKGKSTEKEIAAVRKQYNLPNDKVIYLFVGRLMWYKGIKIIIDALKIKKQHNQPFVMLFVGKGSDQQEIMDYVKQCQLTDECIFTGAISDRDQLKAIFSACDLFLFPSTFDTNGIVVREAAAAQLATVLIKDSCASEGTVDRKNIIQIEENAASLAEILLNYNKDYFHKIGVNASNQLYISWQQSVANAVERYQYVLEKYNYQKKSFVEMDMQDGMFALWAQLSNGIEKARNNRLKIEEEFKEIRKIFKDR